jgi:hypothetical protein
MLHQATFRSPRPSILTSDRFAHGDPVARNGAGPLDFRDFSGLLTAKENRTGSRQTLLQ